MMTRGVDDGSARLSQTGNIQKWPSHCQRLEQAELKCKTMDLCQPKTIVFQEHSFNDRQKNED